VGGTIDEPGGSVGVVLTMNVEFGVGTALTVITGGDVGKGANEPGGRVGTKLTLNDVGSVDVGK
jgi:hypothetical protein